MGKPKKRDLPDLSHLAQPAAEIAVKVTPKASCNAIFLRAGVLCVTVTAVAENGKATAAARNLLALAIGVAPSLLRLKRGQTSRDKLFVYSGSSRS